MSTEGNFNYRQGQHNNLCSCRDCYLGAIDKPCVFFEIFQSYRPSLFDNTHSSQCSHFDVKKYIKRISELEQQIQLMTQKFEEEKAEAVKKQELEVKELKEEQALLREENKELVKRLQSDSSTSSKPSSSDGLTKKNSDQEKEGDDEEKKQPQSLRQKSRRKSGGQPGHKGVTLEQIEHPDKVIVCKVSECQKCGQDLSSQEADNLERRQVFDIPQPIIEVTEYRGEVKRCSCGCETKASFPADVSAKSQYGTNVRAIGAYLNSEQLIPEKRVVEIFRDLFGLNMSSATVSNFGKLLARRLEESGWLADIKSSLSEGELKHMDETGIRVGGRTQWLHTLSNELATVYKAEEKRGDIFTVSQGFVVHDHFSSYYKLPESVKHILCNAHILRELKSLDVFDKEEWAVKMSQLLCDAKDNRKDKRIEANYDKIAQEGITYHESLDPLPSKGTRGRKKRRTGHNLAIRFQEHKDKILRFIQSDKLPFTNNLAERDLRMMKVKLKISGCFRSKDGAQTFAAVRSYTATARKRKLGVYQTIQKLFKGVTPHQIISPNLLVQT